MPLGGAQAGIDVAPTELPLTPATRIPAALRLASPGYFRTIGAPLVAGRDLAPSDDAGAPAVVVVNATLARRLVGGGPIGTAVGRTIRSDNSAFADASGRPRPMTVVGVVGDMRDGGPREAVAPEFYAPLGQVSAEPWDYWIGRELVLVARAAAPPGGGGDERPSPFALAPALRRAVARVDPAVPLHDVRTTGERLTEALAVERFTTRLLVVLGAAGLALAALGIHGVVALAARQRTREMAIRLAVGGSPAQAVGLMMRQGMRPVAAGLAVGAVAAVGVARGASGLLYGVPPLDLVSLGGAVLLLAAVALVACSGPARRVASLPPGRSLGAE